MASSGISGTDQPNVPYSYQLVLPDKSYSQSTIRDIRIPAKRVDIHVQDDLHAPVSNVTLTVANDTIEQNDLPVGAGVTANGHNGYYSTNVVTDGSGNATMWLFPGTNKYTFIAIPPNGSIYAPFTLSDIVINSDQTEIISLHTIILQQSSLNPPLHICMPTSQLLN